VFLDLQRPVSKAYFHYLNLEGRVLKEYDQLDVSLRAQEYFRVCDDGVV